MSEIDKTSANSDITTEKDTLKKTLIGGHWYLLNMVVQKIFIFGTFFITARLLTPADFGLVALAALFPVLIDNHTAIGFETALAQKKAGEEVSLLNVVWTFNVLRAIISFLIIFFSAPYVATFFHAPDAILLFQLSGISVFMQGWTNIGQIYFAKNLDFKKYFIRDFAIQVVTSITTLVGAYFYRSYWALFIGNTSGIFTATAMTYVLHIYRPTFDLHFSKLKPLLKYSRWLFGQELMNQTAQAVENFMVGHTATAANVGLYGKAKSLAQAPTSPIASILGKITFSAYAQIQDSLPHVREGFYKSVDLLASIGIPFLAAVYVAGDHIILLLLGPTWLSITPLLNILIIPFTLNAISSTALPIFNALKQPHIGFRLGLIGTLSIGILIIALVPTYGIIGASITLLVSSILTSIATIFYLKKLINISLSRLSITIGVTMFATIIPTFLGSYLLINAPGNGNIKFLIITGLMSVLYGLIIVFIGKNFKKGPYDTLLLIFRSFGKRT